MYQCQMGKQTMGTPAHALVHRCDGKLYRILTPQAPLVCTHDYHSSNFNLYAQGTNSIVAVISYTGYDMEDAMIISKSAYERGFGHGAVYKTLIIDLDLEASRRKGNADEAPTDLLLFGNTSPTSQTCDKSTADKCHSSDVIHVGVDGLPDVGQKLYPGDPLWCAFYEQSGVKVVGAHKDAEAAYVDAVRFIGRETAREYVSWYSIPLANLQACSKGTSRVPTESQHNIAIPTKPCDRG